MAEVRLGRAAPVAWLPVGVAMVAVLVWALPNASEILAFDRAQILGGDVWRPFSGQLTHWNDSHLFWNVAGAGMLAAWFRDLRAGLWAATGCCAALAVAIGLLIEPHPLDHYRGLSGLLYGWLVVGVLAHADRGPWLHRSIAAAIALWAIAEAFSVIGADRILGGGIPVHAAAHVYGIAGALLGMWIYRTRSRRSGVLRPSVCGNRIQSDSK